MREYFPSEGSGEKPLRDALSIHRRRTLIKLLATPIILLHVKRMNWISV